MIQGAFADLTLTENFTRRCSRYIAIYIQLKTEKDKKTRRSLVQEALQLEESG
jgi:hypothetical protein